MLAHCAETNHPLTHRNPRSARTTLQFAALVNRIFDETIEFSAGRHGTDLSPKRTCKSGQYPAAGEEVSRHMQSGRCSTAFCNEGIGRLVTNACSSAATCFAGARTISTS